MPKLCSGYLGEGGVRVRLTDPHRFIVQTKVYSALKFEPSESGGFVYFRSIIMKSIMKSGEKTKKDAKVQFTDIPREESLAHRYLVNHKNAVDNANQANPNASEYVLIELLSQAILDEKTDAIQYSLENRLDVNVTLNNLRHAPLHFAAVNNRPNALRFLIEKGANKELVVNRRTGTPIQAAIRSNCFPMVQLLKILGATVTPDLGYLAIEHDDLTNA